jgi:hypothetical protein
MKYTTLIAKKAEHPEGIHTIFIIPIFLQLSPGLYGSCIHHFYFYFELHIWYRFVTSR